MGNLKTCTSCKNEKPISEFWKNKTKNDGIDIICKVCNYKKVKKWQLENKTRVRASSKKYRMNHMREITSRRIKWVGENRTKLKFYHIKWKYGISEEDYALLLEKQNHGCAICGIAFDQLKRNPSVDHDHKTGKIRGLLCNDCNGMLGLARDNQSTLKNASIYLSESQEI